MLQHAPGVGFGELGALHHGMTEHQAAIAGKIDIDDFDVRVDEADVVLPRQFAAQPAVAALVVDRIDQDAGPLPGSSCRWNMRKCRISRGLMNWLIKLSSR